MGGFRVIDGAEFPAENQKIMTKMINNQIFIYQAEDGQTKIDVQFQDETVWLTQAQMVELFGFSKANISEHIKNIFTEKELTAEATVRNFRTVQKEGNREVSSP